MGEWLALLPDVSGWGATELAQLLLSADDERACGVLLRRGPAIGNALDLAVGCRLREAIEADDVDEQLFRGAQRIIDALTWGFSGPETLLDLPDAGPTVERFLELLEQRAATVDDLLTADGIARFLEPPTADEEDPAAAEDAARELADAGFDDARLERVRDAARELVDRPEWRPLVEASLDSGDERERRLAIEAAKTLGLPLRDYLIREIEATPNDAGLWYHFAFGADAEWIAEVVRLAERVLDLDALASGPAVELFGPPESEGPHQAAGFVLQELQRFPGVGEGLLLAGLVSPVIRHRLGALDAFSHWPRETLRREVIAAIEQRLRDPHDGVRTAAAAVLAGEPIPESRLDIDADWLEDDEPA